jgi:hypothetical protein
MHSLPVWTNIVFLFSVFQCTYITEAFITASVFLSSSWYHYLRAFHPNSRYLLTAGYIDLVSALSLYFWLWIYIQWYHYSLLLVLVASYALPSHLYCLVHSAWHVMVGSYVIYLQRCQLDFLGDRNNQSPVTTPILNESASTKNADMPFT